MLESWLHLGLLLMETAQVDELSLLVRSHCVRGRERLPAIHQRPRQLVCLAVAWVFDAPDLPHEFSTHFFTFLVGRRGARGNSVASSTCVRSMNADPFTGSNDPWMH